MATASRKPATKPAAPAVVAPRPAGVRAMTYKAAGVDIDSKMKAIGRLKGIARATHRPGVLGEIGSFGGLFDLKAAGSWREPVLVSSTDGVGTKLKVAIALGEHGTIGQDIVNHCVNDILVQGARPLFFLDYIAMGKVDPDVLVEVAQGLAKACRAAQCALIGGETAEMPDIYKAGDYDLAGFVVGAVEKSQIIDGARISPGDVLLGLASSGLHTNGYTLARRVFFGRKGLKPTSIVPELGRSVGEELLAVHRSYLPVLSGILASGAIYGLAHLTGGGFIDNIPRILPKGVSARVDLGSWPVLPVFRYLRAAGRIVDEEMLRTFNMGIGMVVVVPAHRESEVRAHFNAIREPHWRVGEIVPGSRKVIFARDAAGPADWTAARA